MVLIIAQRTICTSRNSSEEQEKLEIFPIDYVDKIKREVYLYVLTRFVCNEK